MTTASRPAPKGALDCVEFKRQVVERMKTCQNIHELARELGIQRKLRQPHYDVGLNVIDAMGAGDMKKLASEDLRLPVPRFFLNFCECIERVPGQLVLGTGLPRCPAGAGILWASTVNPVTVTIGRISAPVQFDRVFGIRFRTSCAVKFH
ncbi:MAG: hypothetical protein P4L56_18865 [Candidatus Sulfopaludibacter sp.]|nr:hypothetical protein [Candidatus Sulfopaludibacter sp.]